MTTKKDRTSLEDMFRLQGMNPTLFKVRVSEAQLGGQVGNSMSVNVLERIFARALVAANLAHPTRVIDRWETGDAISDLKESIGKDFEPRRAGKRIIARLKGDGRKFIVDSGASVNLVNANS